MKKILLIALFFVSISASAQTPGGTGKQIALHNKSDETVDSVLRGPLDTLSRAPAGSFGYKNGQFYGKNATKWGALGGGGNPGGNSTNLQFNSAGAFSGQDNFSLDTTHKALIIQTPSLGTTAPTGGPYGLFLKNPTAAITGPGDQYSPPLHLQGQVWNSTAGSSQNADWFSYVVPTGGTTPASVLRFVSGINGTFTANQLILGSNGAVHFNSAGTNIMGESPVTISESNVNITGYPNLFVKTTDAPGADKGAVLGLGGAYTSGGYLPFALFAGRKENGTSSDYSGYASFLIRKNGVGVLEGMRINSSAHVLIGQTVDSADAALQVNGGVWIKPDSAYSTSTTTNLMFLAMDTSAAQRRGRIVKVPGSALPGGGGGATNISVTRNATNVTIASSTGTSGTLSTADSTHAGALDTATWRLVQRLGRGEVPGPSLNVGYYGSSGTPTGFVINDSLIQQNLRVNSGASKILTLSDTSIDIRTDIWERQNFTNSSSNANRAGVINLYDAITANRTITFVDPGTLNSFGTKLYWINVLTPRSNSFHWSFASTVTDLGGNTITQLDPETTYLVQWDGTNYKVVAKYAAGISIGSSTQSGNGSTTAFTIAHGLANITSASQVLVTPRSSAAAGNFYVTTDATNITITYTTAPASGTNNLFWSYQLKP